MFISEQHERKNGITTPIFPDEIDEDSETSSDYADAESSPSTSNQGQGNMLMALNEWKKKTELFSQCTNLICDPFGQFIPHERVICIPCKEIIRDELFDKLVICWPEEELLELLTNYIYFHAVKILEADAERNYAVNNNKSLATNPHFLAYIEFRRDKAMVLTNFAAAFDFPADLLLSANRSHMTSKHTTSRKELTAMGFAARCKLCRRDQIAVDSTKNYDVFTLSGHRYKHNFEMLKGEETDEPEQFVLCPVHVVYFKSFYHLIHMDWNVHWNCQFRIMQVKQKKPSLDADELIKAVDPEAFKTLANFYIQHLKKLDKYGYYEHILNYCHAVDTTGVKKWLRIKTQIKEEELFKQTLDQMR